MLQRLSARAVVSSAMYPPVHLLSSNVHLVLPFTHAHCADSEGCSHIVAQATVASVGQPSVYTHNVLSGSLVIRVDAHDRSSLTNAVNGSKAASRDGLP